MEKIQPMEKQTQWASAYAWIMRRAQTTSGRKSMALARIGVAYEEVRNYARCATMDRRELSARVGELNTRIRSLCARHGVSRDELQEYFRRNGYALALG